MAPNRSEVLRLDPAWRCGGYWLLHFWAALAAIICSGTQTQRGPTTSSGTSSGQGAQQHQTRMRRTIHLSMVRAGHCNPRTLFWASVVFVPVSAVSNCSLMVAYPLGAGLMVNGYAEVIQALSKNLTVLCNK
jgi:hypothetical protein